MAKGSIAKDNLLKRFATAVGADYVGTEDGKKFYFWSSENGERVQVAITMTVPKTPLACTSQGGDLNFEDADTSAGLVAPTKVKAMDETEAATIARLTAELGL